MKIFGSLRGEKNGDVGQRVQTFHFKMNKFQEPKIEHGGYSQQGCTVYLKITTSRAPTF